MWVQDLLVTLRKMGVEVPPTSSLHCKLAFKRCLAATPPQKPYQVIRDWADTQNTDVYTQLYKYATLPPRTDAGCGTHGARDTTQGRPLPRYSSVLEPGHRHVPYAALYPRQPDRR